MKIIVVKRWVRPAFWPVMLDLRAGTSRRATFGETRQYMRSAVQLGTEPRPNRR